MKEFTASKMADVVYWVDPDYFETVAFEYLVEAVATTKADTGMLMVEANKEAYVDYIQENLI